MIAKRINLRKRERSTLKENTLFTIVFLIILVFLGVGLIISNWKLHQKREELSLKVDELKSSLLRLEEQRKRLTAEISDKNNKYFIEKEAREIFNLRLPGEEVVVIVPLEKASTTQEKKTFDKSWWKIFGF